MKHEEGVLEIGGCRLAFRLDGEGPPLVLVHAGVADARMWEPQLPALTPSFRVIRPDLRGYGRTVKPAEPFAHHEDLRRLLEHLGVEGAAIVGASMGGQAALDLCLEHPRLVGKLVLVASSLGGHDLGGEWLEARWKAAETAFEAGDWQGAARCELEAWLAGPHRVLEDVSPDVAEVVRTMLLRSYELDVDAEELELRPPAATRLGEVRAPTLVVVGDGDVPDMLRIAERLAAGIPGASRIVLEGTAHLPSLEQPRRFAELLVEFLSRHP